MPRRLEQYRFREGVTPLSADNLNNRFFDLDARLDALEKLSMDWDTAISQLQNLGLARIDDSVRPLVDGLRADMVDLIAQGEAAQVEQAAAVQAKLAEVDAVIAVVQAFMAGLAVSLDGAVVVAGQLVKDLVTVGGVQKLRLRVDVPPPPEVPLTDPAQLEYLLY